MNQTIAADGWRFALGLADDAQGEALLDLYQAAIDVREQKPRADVARSLRDPRYRIYTVCTADGVLAGFALVLVADAVAILEYMAVDARHRSHGLGQRLLATVPPSLAGLPLVIEVDDDAHAAPEQAMRARRIGFYRRCGARRLAGLAYQLPLPGDPPPMSLMVLGWPAEKIPLDALKSWLLTLYVDVYSQTKEDARLVQMVQNLADPITFVP